jgi:hypothetical protein
VYGHGVRGDRHSRSDQRVDQHGPGMVDDGNFDNLVPTP